MTISCGNKSGDKVKSTKAVPKGWMVVANERSSSELAAEAMGYDFKRVETERKE